MFHAWLVDATNVVGAQYSLKTGKEYGILVKNEFPCKIKVTVIVNRKLVPESWIINPGGLKTLEKSSIIRNYFVYKAPTKVGGSSITRITVVANDTTTGKLLCKVNLNIVDERNIHQRVL